MAPELQAALNTITAALHPLPDGYFIEADEPSGAVLVYSKYPEPQGLGFAVSAKRVAEGGDFDDIVEVFQDLMQQVNAALQQQAVGEASGMDKSHFN
jgi:hypothetical protein